MVKLSCSTFFKLTCDKIDKDVLSSKGSAEDLLISSCPGVVQLVGFYLWSPEAEFLDAIWTKVLRAFFLLFTVTSANGFYSLPPPTHPEQKWAETDL
jgi:hypothetical protein